MQLFTTVAIRDQESKSQALFAKGQNIHDVLTIILGWNTVRNLPLYRS